MIRAFLDILIFIIFMLLTIPIKLVVLLLRRTGHYDAGNRLAFRTVRLLFLPLKAASGVKLIVRGSEYLPTESDDGVLFVGNHCSYFDIILSACVFKTCTGYIGKKELGRMPLLNSWMLAIGCVFLDRNDPKDGIRMVQKAGEHIANRNSMVIFPEGTRNRNEKESLVGEFHQGSLRIAQKYGCKVIPMAITGSADIFEKHFPLIKSGKVIIEFAPPIDTASMERSEQKHLAAMTHDIILKMRTEHVKELPLTD